MRPISKNQYDLYVFFTRSNWAEIFNNELEWFINDSKTLWGVICLDRQDENYTVILSARDENRQIRCIDVKIDFDTLDSAREYLFSRASELERASIEEKKPNKKIISNIFSPIIKKKKLNDFFDTIAHSPIHSAARNVINEIMPHFFDVDGNFVEQFQTQGFDARLWELYLFCYFNEEGLQIYRKHFAPDFLLFDDNINVGVEAVIVANQEPSKIVLAPPAAEEIFIKKEIMPSRWGSSLYSKLCHTDKSGKHYWEYEHTQRSPFVLAIADFHETFSMTWSQSSLIAYLYGYEHTYSYNEDGKLQIYPIKIDKHSKGGDKEPIPSGFFFQKDAENISAVIHSACATISKFSRIGKQCGFDENDVLMYRIGSVYNPDPNASKPFVFKYLVSEENSEPWSEGVTVFHNPNARYPLPIDFFQNASQCFLRDELIETYTSGCIVYSSMTLNFISESKLTDFKNNFNKM